MPLGSLILHLKGSNCQKVKAYWKNSSSYGAGKSKGEAYWKSLGKMLSHAKYIEEQTMVSGGFRGRGQGGGGRSFSYSLLYPGENMIRARYAK